MSQGGVLLEGLLKALNPKPLLKPSFLPSLQDKALKDCTAASRNDWLAIPAIHFGRWHFNVFEILLLKHTAQGIGFRV